jgi:hypothetical protein
MISFTLALNPEISCSLQTPLNFDCGAFTTAVMIFYYGGDDLLLRR